MIRNTFFLLGVFITILLPGCSNVIYDQPIDANGVNRDLIQSLQASGLDPFGDDDKDSVLNIADPDWEPLRKYRADTIPPVITLLGGDTIFITINDPEGKLMQYRDENNSNLISASDPEGSPVTLGISTDNVNKFAVNEDGEPYGITYYAYDTLSNISYKTRFFYITAQPPVDTIPPNIQIGDTLIFLSLHEKFIEPGFMSYDLGDGKVTPVTVDTQININKAGTYFVTYTSSDSHGNTDSIKRTVIVLGEGPVDSIPPVIELLGEDTIYLPEGESIADFIADFSEPGWRVTDNSGEDLNDNVVVSEITPMGDFWAIRYDVKDSNHNSAQTAMRIIFSEDGCKYPPVIILVGGDDIIEHNLHLPWVDPGFSVSDVQDSSLTRDSVIVDSSDLMSNFDSPGTYLITYTVTNSCNIKTVKNRFVKLITGEDDRNGPLITLLGKNPDTILVQDTYVDPGFTAFDEYEQKDYTGEVDVTNKVNTSKLGTYSIYYSVFDSSRNRGSLTRTVQVVMDTNTTDLLKRYVVPSTDSLPNITGIYTTFDTDGDGPDLSASVLTKVQFTWINNPNNKQFEFYFTYSAPPNFLDMKTVAHDFVTKPQMTLQGTSIEGLDGKYYVTTKSDTLVWVRTDGSFALLLSK